MAGIKRLKRKGDTAVIGNENNDVTLNQRTTVRVTINGNDVVWERPAPNHLWSFEELSGDYIDSINGKVITDSDIVSRVASMHPELNQAIELDAGFEVLTSRPYPYYFVEGLDSSASTVGVDTRKFNIEGLDSGASVVGLSTTELVITYDDGDPEGLDSSASVQSLETTEIVITYEDGDVEGLDSNASVQVLNTEVYVIEYNNADVEGLDSSASVQSLSTTVV